MTIYNNGDNKMITLKTLQQLVRIKIPQKFKYQGMVFSVGSSSAESFSAMFIQGKTSNMSINWDAYKDEGGDGSEIVLLFKIIKNKLIPYKAVHTY